MDLLWLFHGGTSLVSSATSNSTETIMRFVSSSNGLTFVQPAFLTTQSAHTAFAGVLSTGVTGGSGTINSSQIYINVPSGTVYFQDSNGHSFVSSTAAGATTIYIST
jgi:hypothetical protein